MWEAIRANKRRSVLLIFALAAILILLGYGIGLYFHPTQGGPIGVLVALFIWLMLWLSAVTSGRRILLGSVGARRIEHADSPVLFNVVEEMTIASGLPKMPKVYIIDSDAPNAFAVGTEDNSAVAVTSGLLIRLSRDELQGVIAHEIGHIVNNDTRFMTLAGVMVAAIVLIADAFMRSLIYSGGARRRSGGRGGNPLALVALLFAILAPIVAYLLYFACSRRREYLADASGARFTRYPNGLASALEKISRSTGRMRKVNRAIAPMFTVNPLKGSAAHSLFSTHPPTRQRVQLLRSMAGGAAYADYEAAYAQAHGRPLIGRQTLAESEPVAVREPSAEPEKDDLTKARDAVDILHRLNGLLFLGCVCGLKTKVPPGYKQKEIHCPRCGRTAPIPTAVMAAVGAAAVMGAGGLKEVAAEESKAREAEPAVFHYKPGRWQSFRCRCGKTIQLSPTFSAPQVRCRACRRATKIEHA